MSNECIITEEPVVISAFSFIKSRYTIEISERIYKEHPLAYGYSFKYNVKVWYNDPLFKMPLKVDISELKKAINRDSCLPRLHNIDSINQLTSLDLDSVNSIVCGIRSLKARSLRFNNEQYYESGWSDYKDVKLRFTFPNGYGASVISERRYAPGRWEICITHNGDLCYDTPLNYDEEYANEEIYDDETGESYLVTDVFRYFNSYEVEEFLDKIRQLPERE